MIVSSIRTRQYFLLGVVALVLSGCGGGAVVKQDGGPSPGSVDVSAIPDAVPKLEPKSRYGNPDSYVVFDKRYEVMDDSKGFIERGIASWYGEKFHGRRTSSGDTYDMYGMTAAHKHLPLPTYVEVKNLKNGKKIVVRVNDRGPFHENRIIDLSYTAAAKLDIIESGTGLVEIRAVHLGSESTDLVPEPTSTSSVGVSGFFIQVGAFSEYENALTLKNKLDELKGGTRISEVLVNGTTVYRVQLGPISNTDMADKLVSKLESYGVSEHRIVVD